MFARQKWGPGPSSANIQANSSIWYKQFKFGAGTLRTSTIFCSFQSQVDPNKHQYFSLLKITQTYYSHEVKTIVLTRRILLREGISLANQKAINSFYIQLPERLHNEHEKF